MQNMLPQDPSSHAYTIIENKNNTPPQKTKTRVKIV